MKCTPQKRITLCCVLLRDARELEGVAGVVGGVLHLGALVVVGEDDDVALGGEAAEFLLEVVELGHGVTPRIGSECGARVYAMGCDGIVAEIASRRGPRRPPPGSVAARRATSDSAPASPGRRRRAPRRAAP